MWKELLAHAYTSKWSNAPSLLLDVKDYADRYGFGDLADDCGERISAMLSGEPENVMTMAAKAVAMAVSPDGKAPAERVALPRATHQRLLSPRCAGRAALLLRPRGPVAPPLLLCAAPRPATTATTCCLLRPPPCPLPLALCRTL